jgi:hypothetical protein
VSTDRDTTRIVRSWLDEGVTVIPDRLLDAVLDQVPATPQRRLWWPARRFLNMNTAARFAFAAVAAVVLAFVGIRFLAPAANTGGPSQTARPSPIPTPRSLPAPGPLTPGSYRLTNSSWTPVPFTFVVPAGWATDKDGFVLKHAGQGGELGFSAFVVSHVYGSACHWSGTLVTAGSTVDDLANALAAQKERETTGPTTTMLGGFPAKRIVLNFPAAFQDGAACDNSVVRIWPDPGPDEGGGKLARADQLDVVYVVDVNGKRVVIDAWHSRDLRTDVAELDAVIASIRFE